MTLWIIGYFILKLPPAIHLLLALSLLVYIRSLLHISSSSTEKYYRAGKRIR
jgi:hypothetical protein